MKSAAHQYEDKLLEFAYGELPQHEADAVDAHVRGCTRCAHSLSEIRGVRATMAKLPMESAPDAGLESLLAYAEQAAGRAQAKAPPSLWKRFLMPLASVMALATVGVIGFRANQEFDTSRASAVADTKVEERAKQQEQQLAQAEQKPADGLQAQGGAAPAPIVAAAAPEAPAEQERSELQAKTAKADGKNALDDLREAGGKRGDVWSPEPKKIASAPQSVTRRANKTKSFVGNDEEYRQDYSNAAARGALTKDAAPPPPPKAEPIAPAQDKSVGFGLGTPGGTSLGGLGTAGPSTGSGANAPVAKPAPMPMKEEAKKRAKTEEDQPAAQAPAPVAAPSAPPSSAPSTQKVSKGSFGIKPLGSSASLASGEADDSAAVEKSDSLGVDRDVKFAERGRAELRTQSLESARVASNRGDRLSEIRLLAQVLQNGATGYERVEALKRICDAYEALGEPERADPFCDQLLSEFPNTVAAKAVEDRRQRVQRAPAPTPKSAAPTRERKAIDEATTPRPAESVPANAY